MSNYMVQSILYRVLPKKLSPNSCGDIPQYKKCCNCGERIIDTTYTCEKQPEKYICYSCFGKMFLEFDNSPSEQKDEAISSKEKTSRGVTKPLFAHLKTINEIASCETPEHEKNNFICEYCDTTIENLRVLLKEWLKEISEEPKNGYLSKKLPGNIHLYTNYGNPCETQKILIKFIKYIGNLE